MFFSMAVQPCGILGKLWIVVLNEASLLAEALFLVFADGRKETSAMS